MRRTCGAVQVTIFFCRGCGRYLQPPRHWVKADLESRELLTFCIKRIRGLGKVGSTAAWVSISTASVQSSCAAILRNPSLPESFVWRYRNASSVVDTYGG